MQLQRLLFEPTIVRSPLRVVHWWESRRPAYNLIVGGTGLATLVYVNALELALGQGWFAVPWGGPGSTVQMIGIGVYALMANVCYTMGWVVENLVERWLKKPIYGLGPALFRYGLAFSVGLTVLPAVMITAVNVLGRLFAR